MKTTRTIAASAAIAALALGSTALTGPPLVGAHGNHTHGDHTHAEELTSSERQLIRTATRRFQDVDVAIAAGYLPTDECVADPSAGGMGFHYVNPELIGDNVVDPARPEILLYERGQNGKLRLVGVEYMTIDADQDLGTDADRPNLLGHPFDGPMPGHEAGMPVHYDLHAWVFTNNPGGNLSPWNPNVSCPESHG